jgi:hypothetical protein
MMTLAEKIAIMQALERGEEVEVFNPYRDAWVIDENPSWCWSQVEYRISPKPIDLVGVLQGLKIFIDNETGGKLTHQNGHTWEEIINRAKELQQ